MTEAEQTTAPGNGALVAAPVTPATTIDFAPRSFGELMEFAKIVALSDLVPKDYRNKPGNVLVAIQHGNEIGLKPMQALQNIAVINGRATVWGDAVPAILRSKRDFEYIREWFDDPSMTAFCEVKRRGQEPVTRSFSKADAVQARLWAREGPWETYPKRMLRFRALSWACRDCYQDALKGIAIAEEAMDLPPPEAERDINVPASSRTEQTHAALLSQLSEQIQDPSERTGLAAEPANGEGASDKQLKLLHKLLGDRGLKDREAGLRIVSEAIGRKVDSTKDLTKAEASRVIDHVSTLPLLTGAS